MEIAPIKTLGEQVQWLNISTSTNSVVSEGRGVLMGKQFVSQQESNQSALTHQDLLESVVPIPAIRRGDEMIPIA